MAPSSCSFERFSGIIARNLTIGTQGEKLGLVRAQSRSNEQDRSSRVEEA
jgi:hypothetical protein